jgi:hypothetical protein
MTLTSTPNRSETRAGSYRMLDEHGEPSTAVTTAGTLK